MERGDTDTTPARAGTEDLRQRNEELLVVVNELSTRFAAINFKAYEMAEEIRTLEMRLSGTQASHRCLEWENRQLRDEIRFLRKVLLEFATLRRRSGN